MQTSYRTVLVLSGGTRREDVVQSACWPDLIVDSIADLRETEPLE
jgi:NagD protein